ncbi:MAG: TetR/AcrR family transcriptional regulator [Actinomycetota bacterium]
MARTLSAAKRGELIHAAVEVFKEKGPGDATVRDIAGRAGASSATFYRYFKNKEEVYNLIVTDFLVELAKAWGSINELFPTTSPMSQTDAMDAVAEALRRIFEFYVENSETAAVIFRRVVPIDDRFVERGQELLDMFLEQVARIFAALAASGLGTDIDPRLGSAVTVGAVFGASVEYILPGKEVDIGNVVEQFMSVARHGIMTPQGAKEEGGLEQ